MKKNFKLIIEYDGTGSHGWQVQQEDETIQGALEAALAHMTQHPVRVNGSGRTDAGVHALAQVANFSCNTRLGPGDFIRGLNALLPDHIAIRTCEEVPLEFHARKNAKSKLYQYHILNRETPSAVGRNHVWYLRRPLDLAAMEKATECIIGKHDFAAFEATGSARSTTVRRVFDAQWRRNGDCLVFSIEGEGFLRRMVRNIVGTLVEVGQGKRAPDDMKAVLDSRLRAQAGVTAPAQGLFLVRVLY